MFNCHLPPLCIILSLSLPSLSSAADSITSSSSLSSTQRIVSQGGNFALGFFQPGQSSPNKHYIGIWYNKVPKLTVVWVANRATPISDPSASNLTIFGDGNLVLISPSGDVIWSTGTISGSPSNVAVLLDSGNLVLRNGSKVIWQSMDHPTDTWLPGGKLALDKATGESQALVSWTSTEDPAPGSYSLLIDHDGKGMYQSLWKSSLNYWSTGYWNGEIFIGVPELTMIHDFHFNYLANNTSAISRFFMDTNGQFKCTTWIPSAGKWFLFWSQPQAQCQVYAICGPFGICDDTNEQYCTCVRGFDEQSPSHWELGDRSGGCVRKTTLNCGNSSREKDKFWSMRQVNLPDNPTGFETIGSAAACEATCLTDCSCTGYSMSGGFCSIWNGELLNLRVSGGDTLYLRLAASEFARRKGDVAVAPIIAGGISGIVALLCFVWLLVWRCRMRWIASVTEGSLVSFRYNDLLHATKNFSEKLGRGGFGFVFKGTLLDSTVVAVKRLEGIRQGEKQFRAEVSTIGTIQHVNLVRLRGFCAESNQRLLVYEFMPKGSLDVHLFHDGSSVILDWKTRYQIAIGIGRGLLYLHEKCRNCIIHCDIKPENILLDESYVPKVADFGLAKLVGHDFSRVLTTMRGTRGYLAPEWISGLAITTKADVYSYGMMLFEIISGRRNFNTSMEVKSVFFPKLAAEKLIEGDVFSLLDERLGGDANLEELNRTCKVACWCIQDNETSRPTMGQVVQILEGIVDVDMPQIPRLLQIFAAENAEDIEFFVDFSSNQSSRSHIPISTGSQA